jgi:hypothetical protein
MPARLLAGSSYVSLAERLMPLECIAGLNVVRCCVGVDGGMFVQVEDVEDKEMAQR